MKVVRGYRTELEPTSEQYTLFCQCAGAARFAYNFGLARKQEAYKTGLPTPFSNKLQRELTARKHDDLPWLQHLSKWIVQIRQCLSYCQSLIFPSTIYQAAHFHLVRTNDYGLRTYAKNLRDLFPHEVELIREASRSDSRARQKRAAKKFQDTIRLDPLLHRDRARRRSAA